MTSWPMALVLTRSMKSRATLKLTSASSNASRTSRRASPTLASEILPRPRKFLNAFKNLRGLGKISEANVGEALREVRLALLEADVNFKVARDFIERVKTKAIGQEVIQSIQPG